jgi:PAS domain S-box-containing protein
VDPWPRILILGVQGTEARHYADPLTASGCEVESSEELPESVDNFLVILIVRGDLVELCRKVRAMTTVAQVVACVPRDPQVSRDPSKSPRSVVQECLDAGADDVVNAPPSPGVLIARARAGVAQARTRIARNMSERALAALDDIGGSLTSAELESGLQEAVTRLAEALGFTRCAVLALPGDDSTLGYVVAASDDPTLVKLPLDLRKYPEVRAAFDSREPVFIEETATSALLGENAALAAEHGGRSVLTIPLIAERRPIGALFLRSAPGRDPLDDREILLSRIASRMMSAAMRGSRLAESLRESTRRLSLASYQEERRMRALEQYRDFFESAADGVLIVDGEGVVCYVNRAAEQLTGYARGGLQGKKVNEIVVESQRDGLAEVITQASSGVHLAGFDLQVITTSGEPLRVSVSTSAALAEHGAVVLSFRDVTVARALEDELHKTKDFLERLIDSTVDGIISADIKGNVIVFNQGAEHAYGYTADEVIGKLPVWKLYPDGVAKQIMAMLRSAEHGGVGRLEPMRREIVTKHGEIVPVSLTASIIYEDGREVASVGIISDLRERLKIEQRLQQAQEKLIVSEKQALIAELAGTTAHELNQPLTSVMGYAELIKKRMGSEDGNSRAVDIILREAERMAEIVRKIGKITRYETKTYVGSTTILDLDKSTTEG